MGLLNYLRSNRCRTDAANSQELKIEMTTLKSNWPAWSLLASVLLGALFATAGQSEEPAIAVQDGYPPGELGKIVRLGEDIVRRTSEHPLSKPYVGNALNCTSCHLDAGRHETAASFLGTAAAYPAWSPREQRVLTLEEIDW